MLDRRVHVVQAECLEEPKDLHVLPASGPARTRLHQPAKGCERIGQLPTGERRRLVQRSDLALDERQVVQRVKDGVFALVGPAVAGDDLGAAPDHHLLDVGAHPHLVVSVGNRDGVVVGLEAHQRLRAHLTGGLMAGIERRRG